MYSTHSVQVQVSGLWGRFQVGHSVYICTLKCVCVTTATLCVSQPRPWPCHNFPPAIYMYGTLAGTCATIDLPDSFSHLRYGNLQTKPTSNLTEGYEAASLHQGQMAIAFQLSDDPVGVPRRVMVVIRSHLNVPARLLVFLAPFWFPYGGILSAASP
jgi:hypothetical protein